MTAAWEHAPERASVFWINLIVWIARRLGRGVARLILGPVALYYLLTGTEARRASRAFLRRTLGREPRWREVWKHFFTFAAVTLDRVFVLIGGPRRIELALHDVEAALATAGRGGCLALVAHLGSFEVARLPAIERYGLPLKILMDRAQAPLITGLLERLNPELARSVIDASARGPDLVLRLREQLDGGAVIGIMADRVRAGERSVTVDFMGGKAQLPATPWILAGVLGVPVLALFCVYRGGRTYDAWFEDFAARVDLPRDRREQALAEVAQRYAARLEHHARAAPFNWFNFYDFWDRA